MFLTLQRLITQSKRVFLRETTPTEDNFASTAETDSSTATVKTEQGEAMQTLQQQLKETLELPFLVRRNIKQLREQRQFERA